MRAFPRFTVLATVVATSISCVACTSNSEGTDSASVTIPDVQAVAALPDGATNEANTLAFCTSAPFEPWEWKTSDGDFTGFDIDTAKHTAKALGATANFVEVPYAEVATGDALATDQCDVLVAALPIDDVRSYTHRFTRTYLDTQHTLVGPADTDPASLTDFEGMNIGVVYGSDGETVAPEQLPGAQLVALPDVNSTLDAISAGDVALGFADSGTAGYLTRDRDEFAPIKTVGEPRSLGMAVRPDNEALANILNQALEHLDQQGVSKALATKWFGDATSAAGATSDDGSTGQG